MMDGPVLRQEFAPGMSLLLKSSCVSGVLEKGMLDRVENAGVSTRHDCLVCLIK